MFLEMNQTKAELISSRRSISPPHGPSPLGNLEPHLFQTSSSTCSTRIFVIAVATVAVSFLGQVVSAGGTCVISITRVKDVSHFLLVELIKCKCQSKYKSKSKSKCKCSLGKDDSS